MEYAVIEIKVKNIVEDVIGEKPTLIQNFKHDLKMDSLEKVEMVMLVEKEFNIDIEDDEFDNIQTVEQLINAVNKKCNDRDY